jgi:hypothetical protein
MSFAATLHGDIAQCVAHCLALRDLAHWSRVDRSGRQIVAYKFSHFKCLDLTRYPTLSLVDFGHLCARLRGVDVLVLPYEHSCLIHSVNVDVDSNDLSQPKFGANARGVREFFQLVDANLHSLQFILQKSAEYPSSNGHYNEVFSRFLQNPLFDRLHRMPKLKSLHLAVWMNRDIVTRVFERRLDHIYGLTSTIEPPPMPEEVAAATPVLSEAESAAYAAVTPPAPASPVVPFMPDVRIINPLRIGVRSFQRFGECFPSLESCNVHIIQEDDAFLQRCEEKYTRSKPGDETEERRMKGPGQPAMGADIERVQMAVERMQNLLYLSIFFDDEHAPFRPHSVLEFHLPHVLQLVINADQTSISDVKFHCPQLQSINMQMQFLASNELQEELQSDDAAPVHLAMPPSFLTSLRRSPFVRFLVVIDAESPIRNADYTESLSAEEKIAMDAKAAALGQPSLFGPYTDETRDAHFIRILFYALSLLPCASQLELIENCSPHLSSIEFFTLFPTFRSFIMSPPHHEMPVWLRPPPLEDGLHLSHITQRLDVEFVRCWDRLRVHEDVALADVMRTQPPQTKASLILVDQQIHFTLPLCQTIINMRTFDSLSILLLAAPTRIDSAAITQLLAHCRQLQHVSLIQLEGIGDEVFTQLPSDFIHPALLTLRLKAVCNPAVSIRLTPAVLPLLTSLFPHLTHFEYLSPSSDVNTCIVSILEGLFSSASPLSSLSVSSSAVSSTMTDGDDDADGPPSVPSSMVWPALETLTVSANSSEQHRLVVERLAQTMLARRSPAATRLSSDARPLTLVSVDLRADFLISQLDSFWPTHARELLNRTFVCGEASNSLVTVERHEESICFDVSCPHPPHGEDAAAVDELVDAPAAAEDDPDQAPMEDDDEPDEDEADEEDAEGDMEQ